MFNSKVGNYRWSICILLFFATTINYVDRQVLAILAPSLQSEFNWSDRDYGFIVTSFQVAYAIGFLFMGYLVDRFGSKVGYSVAIVIWSTAAMVHAFCRTALGFGLARFTLGLGEAGNFPAAVKVVSEWFPTRERAFSTGIFVSGASVGAIITPLMVPVITLHYGWQSAFIFTGLLGFAWLTFWLIMYAPPGLHKRVSPTELIHIQSDVRAKEGKISWISLLRFRQTWAFALAKFLTDPVFSFFFFFLPKFLYTNHGVTLDKIAIPIMVIYLMSDLGSIAGGMLSSFLIKKNWSVNASRKTAMLIAAVTVTPVYFASQAENLWTAVFLIGLALAAHQAWSANLFTIASDMFPAFCVGSVIGVGSTLGAVGGMFGATIAGFLLDTTGSYAPLFLVAAAMYLVGLTIIHLLVPALEPAQIPNVVLKSN
jgi:MFS transporter, ACS family, hexuronate transporter